MAETFTPSWTTGIDYQLKKNGAAFDATGMTVTTILKDRAGREFTPSGGTTWAVQATSQVRFTPAVGDFTVERSPIAVRFRVTDGGGKVAEFPRNAPEEWVIE